VAEDGEVARRINLARLSGESRAKAWAFIQAHRPVLAEFMRGDVFKLLRDGFGCSPILTLTKKELRQIHGQH